MNPPPPPPPADDKPVETAKQTLPSPRRKPWTRPELEKGRSLGSVRMWYGGMLSDAQTSHSTRES